jgi:hypothetical protein
LSILDIVPFSFTTRKGKTHGGEKKYERKRGVGYEIEDARTEGQDTQLPTGPSRSSLISSPLTTSVGAPSVEEEEKEETSPGAGRARTGFEEESPSFLLLWLLLLSSLMLFAGGCCDEEDILRMVE